MKQKHKKAERIGLKIVLGAAGGIMFGLGIKEVLFEYVLPASLQTPLFMVILGFVFLFIATKV